MRKILGSFLCVVLLALTGCANPIQSVELALNPLGGFDVTVVFANGATIQIPNVSPGQLTSLQRKYNIRESQIIRRTASVGACGQQLAQVVDLTGTVYETRKPSLGRRVVNVFSGHSSCYLPASVNASTCAACDPIPQPDNPDWPHYDVQRPAATVQLEARVSALEADVKRILAIAEKLQK